MILDIFSSFDPIIYTSHISLFLVSPLFLILILSIFFWLQPTHYNSSFLFPFTVIFNQRNRSLGNNLKSFSFIVTPLFFTLITLNLIGIIPYIFSTTRHLIFTLRIRIPLWMFLIISSVSNKPSDSISVLLPRGAPEWLNPFLILIEIIRISIRPITLGFRLAANITAGHVVLGLLGSYITSIIFSSIFSSFFIIIIQILYIIFEIGICFIQAYIFCLLITLYANDHS